MPHDGDVIGVCRCGLDVVSDVERIAASLMLRSAVRLTLVCVCVCVYRVDVN